MFGQSDRPEDRGSRLDAWRIIPKTNAVQAGAEPMLMLFQSSGSGTAGRAERPV